MAWLVGSPPLLEFEKGIVDNYFYKKILFTTKKATHC